MAKPHYRAGVVIVIRHPDGRVMAFERNDPPGEWQLPQGGIDRDERAVDAAWRELEEETGLTAADVELVGDHDELTVYEWPTRLRDSDRLGQVHRWFFFAPRDPATIAPTPDGSEFVDWAWMDVGTLIDQVVEFRRGPYRQVLGGRR